MTHEYEVMGVYSHCTASGGEVREEEAGCRNSTFWFVRQRDDGVYEVRPLDNRNFPSGVVKLVPKAIFLKEYTPELSYYQLNPLPCLESLRRKVSMGRRLFSMDGLDREERAFLDAVLVEEQVEAEEKSAMADVYAEQRRFSRLRDMLDKLLNAKEELRELERHRFNEYGMDLRKQEQYDDSIRFYAKALEVNETDENLHFNIARAYHGKKQLDKCRAHLEKALVLNPDMNEAKGFLRALDAEEAEQENRGRGERKPGATAYDLKF